MSVAVSMRDIFCESCIEHMVILNVTEFADEVIDLVKTTSTLRENFNTASSRWMKVQSSMRSAAVQFEALQRPELLLAIATVDKAIAIDVAELASGRVALEIADDALNERRASCKTAMEQLLKVYMLLNTALQVDQEQAHEEVRAVYLNDECSEFIIEPLTDVKDEGIAAACTQIVHDKLPSWDPRRTPAVKRQPRA
jgi:hypothetical protein